MNDSSAVIANLPPVQSSTYSKFERGLSGWAAFERAATSLEHHWFKDLLAQWCPSGHPSGKTGLRLAVRDGYLNFYRCGQSVARVKVKKGELVAEVHYKYVLGDLPGYTGPLYLCLTTKGVFFPDALGAMYDGLSTLLQWIGAAGGEKYAGDEKSLVDDFVTKNESIVDLEMAIPAWGSRKSAVRMDLVAIEDGKVVFWEVKTVNDGRIRCRADFEKDKFPEVLKQLSNYRVFLEQDQHVEQVERAYRHTAQLLIRLRALADKLGPVLSLGPSIKAAGTADRLAVERHPALVVVDLPSDKKRSWVTWKDSHEGKLKGQIPMLVLEHPAALRFENAL